MLSAPLTAVLQKSAGDSHQIDQELSLTQEREFNLAVDKPCAVLTDKITLANMYLIWTPILGDAMQENMRN